MAFNISNLLATLDSSIAALDSASELLEVLQAINATNSTKGYGKTQRKYYTSVASLPAADSAMRGMVAVVSTAVEDSDNGLYLCTGTAWTEIQSLDSTTPPTQAQGVNFGYTSGGIGPGGTDISNVIDKFSFTSDANATDVGNLTQARYNTSGQSSTENGYTSGGQTPSIINTIDKFPFASDANASDVGDLTEIKWGLVGQMSAVSGYTSGGRNPGAAPNYKNTIEKFPFASDTNASDVGDLTVERYGSAGQSSTSHGYTSGGDGSTVYNTIDKFPFATDANATDVGDLLAIIYNNAGQNSRENGYSSGGWVPQATVIQKFPFASDANSTDVGDLTVGREQSAGQSSTASGYTSGGVISPPNVIQNVIDKFDFASDGNATDVGDLSIQRKARPAGQQY
jgi:hypothetical protein